MTTSYAPADAPALEVPEPVFRSEPSPVDFPHQEVSQMKMICRWVRADDGALVMEWTTAEDTAVHRGTGGDEAANAFAVFDCSTHALIPVGV